MPLRAVIALATVVVVGSACSGGGGGTTTTTTVPSTSTVATTTTTLAPVITEGTTGGSTTSEVTTTLPLGLPEYTIQARTSDDVIVVLLEPGTYSDLDLQNVVADATERFAPVTELHIIDEVTATEAVLKPEAERTPEEQALLEDHYFVRLEEGFRIVFTGPFSDVEDAILGS